jgi:hypothetical protein
MKETIKILKEWIEVDRRKRNYSNESDFDKFCEEKCVAIENLIKRNEELEEIRKGDYETICIENKHLRERIEELEENKIMSFQETQLKNYIEEIKKYDYRNIKINKKDEIESINFTKEKLESMNFGIALYKSIENLSNNDVIKKSKIKEKIEELKENKNKLKPDDLVMEDYYNTKIQVLEELLGG